MIEVKIEVEVKMIKVRIIKAISLIFDYLVWVFIFAGEAIISIEFGTMLPMTGHYPLIGVFMTAWCMVLLMAVTMRILQK